MTCNQLMVLLDMYRGSYQEDRHIVTAKGDILCLQNQGYLTNAIDPDFIDVTNLARRRIKSILEELT